MLILICTKREELSTINKGGKGMIILNITNPMTIFLLLIATILLIFLGHELKKSYIVAIPLAAFTILIVTHVLALLTLSAETIELSTTLIWCIVEDCAFILVSLLSYLWIDDIEAKVKNKKSIDNSLDWFWKKV